MASYQLSRVLVLLSLSSAAGRKKLNGLHRFLNEGNDWDIELIRSDQDFKAQWNRLRANDYDGILASTSDGSLIGALADAFDMPAAFIAYPQEKILRRHPLSVFVMDGENAIAHAAAGHLIIQCHAKTLAYVPTRERTKWSERRQQAFAKELSRRHRELRVYRGDGASRERLAEWLRGLPKPAGILAAYDDRACDVIESCRIAAIDIPNEISVLGIGNDDMICEMVSPNLTSIVVDFEQQGYQAARELQAMMLRRRKPTIRTIVGGIRDLVIRASSSASRADALTDRALDYINRHALDGIMPTDVIRHLGISRSLAYLRFRQTTGISILDSILEHRLGEVKRLLSSTALPMSEIAVRCGYRDANYLKNQFRRRFGMTMSSWRKTH